MPNTPHAAGATYRIGEAAAVVRHFQRLSYRLHFALPPLSFQLLLSDAADAWHFSPAFTAYNTDLISSEAMRHSRYAF